MGGSVAKRRRAKSHTVDGQTIGPGNEKLNELAGDLGRLLGTAHGRAWAWLKQRQAAITELAKIRDTAVEMLSELGVPARTPRGRRPDRAKAALQKPGKLMPAPAPAKKPAARKRSPATRKKAKAASKTTR
jgi:hypothetical protein